MEASSWHSRRGLSPGPNAGGTQNVPGGPGCRDCSSRRGPPLGAVHHRRVRRREEQPLVAVGAPSHQVRGASVVAAYLEDLGVALRLPGTRWPLITNTSPTTARMATSAAISTSSSRSSPPYRGSRRVSVQASASTKELSMLYAFGFEKVGVVVGDLYFVDPRPPAGQEGAERGRAPRGPDDRATGPARSATPRSCRSTSSARSGGPTSWRPSRARPAATTERTTTRRFAAGSRAGGSSTTWSTVSRWPGWASSSPISTCSWRDPRLPTRARSTPDDVLQLRGAVPEILEVLRRLLERVHAGELASLPNGSTELGAVSWLALSAGTGLRHRRGGGGDARRCGEQCGRHVDEVR